MNHEEQVILYAAGQLSEHERARFEEHLADCSDCRQDLRLWQMTAEEIRVSDSAVTAPAQLAERILEGIRRPASLQAGLRRAWQLLSVQTKLVQHEMWPASAAVMALGTIVALLSDHIEVIYFIAPLIAAASLAILFNPEYDPALELTLATPTSPWKVLLARLSIVFGYNFLLALAASFALVAIIPPELLGTLMLGWLGPMTFLSALALLLSLWMGTNNAIAIVYGLWLVQYVPYQSIGTWVLSPAWKAVLSSYQQFWHSPLMLLLLSILLIGAALWSVNKPIFNLTQNVA